MLWCVCAHHARCRLRHEERARFSFSLRVQRACRRPPAADARPINGLVNEIVPSDQHWAGHHQPCAHVYAISYMHHAYMLLRSALCASIAASWSFIHTLTQFLMKLTRCARVDLHPREINIHKTRCDRRASSDPHVAASVLLVWSDDADDAPEPARARSRSTTRRRRRRRGGERTALQAAIKKKRNEAKGNKQQRGGLRSYPPIVKTQHTQHTHTKIVVPGLREQCADIMMMMVVCGGVVLRCPSCGARDSAARAFLCEHEHAKRVTNNMMLYNFSNSSITLTDIFVSRA